MTEKLTESKLADIEEAKPCPFCGQKPNVIEHKINSYGDFATSFVIECSNSKCAARPYVAVTGPWGYRRPDDLPSNDSAKGLVLERWNTRDTAVCAEARVKELEARLERVRKLGRDEHESAADLR